MTDQVAGITLRADSSQIQTAAKNTVGLGEAAAQAEKQVDSLAEATKKTGASARDAATAIGAQAKAVEAVAKGQDAATAAISATAEAYQKQIDAGETAVRGLRAERQASRDRVAGLTAERAALLEAAKAEGSHSDMLSARARAIQADIAAERQRAASLQQSITTQRTLVSDAKAQAAALDAQSQAMSRNAKLAEQLGTSQKNLAFASRNAVFQLQDIAVSLDMGMPVYRVLLQQVPQVTGAFGGFGNTLRYLGALLGPVGIALTATSAVLGTMAVFATRSERAMSSLNKTLTLTNGYSGLTADAIIRMGENADAAGRSFSRTVDTVQALAAAGVRAGSDFEKLAQVANEFSDRSGIGIEELVSQMAKLSSDPVGGLRELQNQYHNVTDAQIQHVQKLVEQGDKARATAEANEILIKSFTDMSSKIVANMGTLEKAMDGVQKVARGMWDAILDVGRPETGDRKIKFAQEEIGRLESQIKGIQDNIAANGGNSTQLQRDALARLTRQVELSKESIKGDQAAVEAKKEQAEATSKAAAEEQKHNDLMRAGADFAAKYATNAQQRNKELANAKKLYENGAFGQGAEADKKYAAIVAEINDRLKDPKVQQAQRAKIDAGVKMVENARAELEQLKQTTSIRADNANMGQREKAIRDDIFKLQQEAMALQARADKDHLTKAEEQQLAEIKNTVLIKEQSAIEAKRIDALEKANKAHAQTQVYLTTTQQQIEGIQQGYALSADAAADLVKKLELVDRLQRAGASADDIKAAQARYDELVEAQAGSQATLSQGFSRGIEDSVKAMGNGYTQMADLTKTVFSEMENAMAGFFETGKFGAKDMINAILKELIRLATSSALKSIVQAFGGGAGAGGSLFGALFKATASANGNVMSGGNLSAYSGQIVDQPTFFNFGQLHKFANGAGLMGEAGPEAIMPLKRGRDGKLGVAGGGGGISVDVDVIFNSDGSSKTNVNGNSSTANAWAQGLSQTIKSEIVKATQPGGVLYKSA